jgi:hypothetical protein
MKEWLDEAKAKGIPRGPVAATSSLYGGGGKEGVRTCGELRSP